MCLVLEIIMLLVGHWTLVRARVPVSLVGGGKYDMEGTPARVMGAVLMLPLPAASLMGLALGSWFGEQGIRYAYCPEVAFVVGAIPLAAILVRVAGRPVTHASEPEALIAKRTQSALMYAVLTATGLGAIVGCPLAFANAGQALRLIDEHRTGEGYRSRARAARVIVGVVTGFWVVGGCCLLSVALVA